MTAKANRVGRPKKKAEPRLFCLRKDLDTFLIKEAKRTNKTYVDLVERGLELLRTYKPGVRA